MNLPTRLREPGSIKALVTAGATIAGVFVAPDKAAAIATVGAAVVTVIAVLTPEAPRPGLAPTVPPVALLLLALGLSACTQAQTDQATTILRSACVVDGQVQPVAVAVAGAAGGSAAGVAATDAALVHPAVVAACRALGGVPG